MKKLMNYMKQFITQNKEITNLKSKLDNIEKSYNEIKQIVETGKEKMDKLNSLITELQN